MAVMRNPIVFFDDILDTYTCQLVQLPMASLTGICVVKVILQFLRLYS